MKKKRFPKRIPEFLYPNFGSGIFIFQIFRFFRIFKNLKKDAAKRHSEIFNVIVVHHFEIDLTCFIHLLTDLQIFTCLAGFPIAKTTIEKEAL